MKKRALKKDFHMEIKKTLNRFLSIFFIVAMGVAFYSGIQASAPDMRATGDDYYDQTNLMDIKVISTLGLTDGDIQAMNQVEGIACAEPAYMTDVLSGQGENQKVLHVESLLDTLNQVVVTQGRLPEKTGECFLDADFMDKTGYQVGDTIKLILPEEDKKEKEAEDGEGDNEKEKEEKESSPLLRHTELVITGRGNSSAYLSYSRGSTSLGNGELSGFLYVLPEEFDSEVYMTAYLTVEGAKELTSYTSEYDDQVERALDQVEAIAQERCEIRYREVKGEAESELADARGQLEDGTVSLQDAKEDLEKGKKEAESELADARTQLEDGRAKLEDGKQELADARQELADGWSKLSEGESQLAANESQLAEGRQQLASGEAQAAAAEKELKQKQSEYDASAPGAKQELAAGEAQLEQAKTQLEEGTALYNQKSSELSAARESINQAAETLESSRQEYTAGNEAYLAAEASYAEQKAALDAAWGEYEAGQASYEQQKQAYDASAASLAQMQATRDASLATAQENQSSIDALTAENGSLQGQIDTLTVTLGTLEGELNGLNSQIAEASARLETMEDGEEKDALLGEIAAWEGQKAEKEAQKNEANASVSGWQAQIAANQEAIAAAEAARDAANAEAAALEPSIRELSTALAAQAPALEGAAAQLAQTKTQLDTNTAALNGARTQLDAQKTQLDAAAAELTQGEAQLARSQSELSAGETQLEQSGKELEKGKAELEKNQAEIEAGYQELAEGEAKLKEGWAQLNGSKQQLESSRSQLASGEAQLNQGKQTLESSRAQLNEGEQAAKDAQDEIDKNEKEIRKGWREYWDGKKQAESEIESGQQKISEAEEELKEAQQKIDDAQKQVDDIKFPEWYVYDRSCLTEYTGYGENADRMTNIGKVFPVLFFLVAALISLTTMTRMVEEERTQTGTLKALGYGKRDIASKYMKYALYATLGGSVFGVLIGEKILPYIIIYAYGMMYHHIPKIIIPYNWEFGLAALAASLVCTLGATYSACSKEMVSTPAKLMRPPAPKEGKRVLLERIPFFWKHLSFTWKSTLRNLFRYKKRFFMTVTGIGGCMGLLLVGFGLKDSIMNIGRIQYDQLQYYDAMVIENPDAGEEEKEALYQFLGQEESITRWKRLYAKLLTARGEERDSTLYLYVVENTENLEEFMVFRDRTSKEEYHLTDEGAIITEKLATMLGIEAGGTITLEDDELGQVQIPVTAVVENYLYHYVYLTPACYRNVYGKDVEFNSILVNVEAENQEQIMELGGDILVQDGALNVTYTGTIADQLEDMLGSLYIVIAVLIISAGMLAFVVLYNLNNININERKRELATIKVLGFYNGEVDAYVYRENILLTAVGAAAGIGFGIFLHRFIITTVEVDVCMFGRNINLPSFIYSILFTFGFSALVNAVMHFKLKKIDMVESLKSVE